MKVICCSLLLIFSFSLTEKIFAQNSELLGYTICQLYPVQNELLHGRITNLLGQRCTLDDVRKNPMQLYILIAPDTAILPGTSVISMDTTKHPEVIDTVIPMGGPFDTTRQVAPNGRNHPHLCDLPQAETDTLLNLIFAHPCPPFSVSDSSMIDSVVYHYQHGGEILYEPEVMGNMPQLVNKNVLSDLVSGFSQMQQPATQLDSMMVVVNYIYVLYIYDARNAVTSTNIDSLAGLMAEGILRGQCGDLTHFTNLVITELFPWWGCGVELNSNSDSTGTESCNVAHVFLGLANTQGVITAVLDPTVNAIWVDSLNGNPLPLAMADTLLLDSGRAWRVTKRYVNTYGQYHSETGPMSQPCVFGVEFTEEQALQLKAYWLAQESQDSIWIIKGPWPNFDSQPKYAYFWNELGFPSNKWANNLLIIRSAVCSNPVVGALVQQRYGFTVN